jgi:negative regulator of sigma E activity
MTMHEEWTDRLSEYLDGELPPEEAAAVGAHLRECAACSAVLNDLKRVVAQAEAAANLARPPQADLWAGIAARIDAAGAPHAAPARPAPVATFQPRAARRIAFTLPQLAAAALVVAAVSGALVWQLRSGSPEGLRYDRAQSAGRPERPGSRGAQSAEAESWPADVAQPFRAAEAGGAGAHIETVGLADAQYDAAVADLEKALKTGRGRLDASTIAIVEHNLQIIDQAISQAREALAGDPANTYLSSHLVEARRRKLDLLRRATALATDMN